MSSTDRLFRCITTLQCVCVDMRDASSWDRKPADYTSVGYLTPRLPILSVSSGIFNMHIYLHIRLLVTGEFNSWEELCIYAYVVTAHSHMNAQTSVGSIYIYIYIYVCIFISTDKLFRCITPLQCG